MTCKPQVFKMGGAWVWQCRHSDERQFRGSFTASDWRNPWDVCLADALGHHAKHHAEVEVIEP